MRLIVSNRFLTRCSVAVSAILIGLRVSVFAHPGHSHGNKIATPRTWTIASKNDPVIGEFVSEHDGRISIRDGDGQLIQLKYTELSDHNQSWVNDRVTKIRRINWMRDASADGDAVNSSFNAEIEDQNNSIEDLIVAKQLPRMLAQINGKTATKDDQIPEMAKAFEAFVKTKAIHTRWDENYFYVESKGIPDHRMMVGIASWQQQVPLPQNYTGENSWQIPLNPKPAKKPLSTKNRFLRGAIAIAVNGVPIFNPLNNRGDDAFLFGELDEYGGHCGRADDYHYHLAPVHLEKINGKGLPIAYALDGYPIYGYNEPDGSKVKGLDAFNGHEDASGSYHYHATKTYPYLNGGFHGDVVERGDQVDPQPRSEPIRPDLRPLRDAKIVDFVESKPGSYLLTYEINGKKGTVSYTVTEKESVSFTFVEPGGKTTTETYSPGRRSRGQPPPRRKK